MAEADFYKNAIYKTYVSGPIPDRFPKPYTIVGDTDHADIAVLRRLRDTFRAFAQSEPGVPKHVFLESSQEFENIFNAVKTHKATLDSFQKDMPVFSNLPVENWKEGQNIFKDILKIALDHDVCFYARDTDDASDEISKKYPDVREAIDHAHHTRENEYMQEKMKDPAFAARVAAFDKELIEERHRFDVGFAETVRRLTQPSSWEAVDKKYADIAPLLKDDKALAKKISEDPAFANRLQAYADELSAANEAYEVATAQHKPIGEQPRILGKTMIIYGSGHMQDLGESLGVDDSQGVFVINLATKKGQQEDKDQDFPALKAAAAMDPHAMHGSKAMSSTPHTLKPPSLPHRLPDPHKRHL